MVFTRAETVVTRAETVVTRAETVVTRALTGVTRGQIGDADEWDLILSSRLALLRRMHEGRESKGAVKEGIEGAIRRTYLALGGMARYGGWDGGFSVQRLAFRVSS